MSDLLRLLHMLQGGPGAPPVLQERAAAGTDPYAESLFQQAYGPQEPVPVPQMENAAHPGIERFAQGASSVLENSGYRPRNFGEGLLLGAATGATGAIAGKAQGREVRNATSKAEYKAAQKAQFDEQKAARAAYRDLAKAKSMQKPEKPEQTLEDKVKEKSALVRAGIEAADKARKDLGIPRWKPEPAMGEIDPSTVDGLAEMFRMYGYTVPRGVLTNPVGRAVLDKAFEQPGANPIAGKADFAANQAALTQITKNLNAVEAFGKTAEKNAQVMLNRMKLVPDTGIPYFNTPIRELARKGGGSAEVSAYRAALTTVIPEFSRILNNPNLTGQLTDTARKEMEHVIDGSSTLNQMMKTLEVLKQDKENRIKDLRSQQESLRQSIRGGAMVSPDGSAPAGNVVKWGKDAQGNPVPIGGQ